VPSEAVQISPEEGTDYQSAIESLVMSRSWDSNPGFNQICIEALNPNEAIDQRKPLFIDKPTVEIRRRSQKEIQWFQPSWCAKCHSLNGHWMGTKADDVSWVA
jgi:hypothetical protein